MTTTKPASKVPKFEPTDYMLTFGPDTAAPEGLVLVRISRAGRILVEDQMPPAEFLRLAHSFEHVARGIRNVLDGKPAG